MKTMSKALIGTVAAGAMAVTSASPAMARDRDRGDGIGAGEIIAGALVIGGIAAIASSASRDRGYDRNYDRNNDRYGYRDDYSRYGYRDRDDYNRRGNPRQAVEMCVRSAERDASRHSYGNAKVTDVRDIKRTNGGYTVKGRIAVNNMGRDWRSGDRAYGRGWNNDYRGWNNRYRGYDAGSFTCKVRYGRVTEIDYKNIRGL
ncbi:hypothetical protein NT2_02_02930 [Caenibius tardaugens NBRC 16725]|uniref:17 kDa surface antigen n=1 Tax=Caenibius tardaugens NBRC 16725 TaxID=1219035 RepID=U2Y508_9SPHN|nr:hypothetical protein [Caenibius tardaugens]AZI34697.1 hypothetical protein EGO55_01005 [Caenibius tardaugens NBRC 16725]GAD48211.1 hypothetical protein NT2_02_02930 [Caenibius tardaugens NBRC 16725]